MWKFLTYLSKKFIIFWLTVVFGFLVLIGLLDSLANGADIFAAEGAKFTDTFRYILYRLPVIFDRVFMFTLVVATLFVFVSLIRNHELVALIGFGLSVPKQISLLAPIMLTCTIVSVTLINLTMPPSVRALQAWGIGEYKIKNITDKTPLWLEDGNDIVRAAGRPSMNTLSGLQIFKRNLDGELEQIIWAQTAEYSGKHWNLNEVHILDVADANGEPRLAYPALRGLTWDSNQNPDSIARLAADPRDLSLADQKNFREKGNSGSNPRFAYGFWYLHRLTRPLAALVLLICCVPIMQRTARQDTGDKALFVGLSLGFIFLIVDGAMATFATSGGMAISWSIIAPLAIFSLLGAYLCLEKETLSARYKH